MLFILQETICKVELILRILKDEIVVYLKTEIPFNDFDDFFLSLKK